MILSHKMALDPTVEPEIHVRQAAGVARLAWNRGLTEWKRMLEAGEKATANKIKIKWNAIRRAEFPFTYDVTQCASHQSIMNLGPAFNNFFCDVNKQNNQRKFRYPRFKKKRRCRDSFALWNDQFEVRDVEKLGTSRGEIGIPNLGWVDLREPLRLDGKIMGAVVSRTADRWFVAIQVESPDHVNAHPILI